MKIFIVVLCASVWTAKAFQISRSLAKPFLPNTIGNGYGAPIAPLETIGNGHGAPIVPLETIGNGYGAPIAPLETIGNGYGAPIAPIAPPLETINLPDQGPGVLLPLERASITNNGLNFLPPQSVTSPLQFDKPNFDKPSISNTYGVPIAPLQQIELSPIEQINLPEQGPILLQPLQRTPITIDNGFGEPSVPLQTIDLSEQRPVASQPLQRIPINNGYGSPITPIAPLQTINLPEQGPITLQPLQRIPINNGYGAPITPIAPLQTIDLPEQDTTVLIPPQNRLNPISTLNPELGSESMRISKGSIFGSYYLIDRNGKFQEVKYEANPNEGFKVLSEPLVKDTIEVQKAKEEFFEAYKKALERNS